MGKKRSVPMLIYSLQVSIYLIPHLNFYNLDPHSPTLFHMIMCAP